MAKAIKTRKSDEHKRHITHIGDVSHQIVGAKLPSNEQVLKVFFYNMRYVNLAAKESAKLAIDAAMVFWRQARIPTRDDHKCTEKLLKLYEIWKNLNKKPVNEMKTEMKQKYDVFIDQLDDLFDIVRADALTIMTNEEDKEFLRKQREDGRPGSMLGVDKKLYAKESRSKLCEEREEERRNREEARKFSYERGSTSVTQPCSKYFE